VRDDIPYFKDTGLPVLGENDLEEEELFVALQRKGLKLLEMPNIVADGVQGLGECLRHLIAKGITVDVVNRAVKKVDIAKLRASVQNTIANGKGKGDMPKNDQSLSFGNNSPGEDSIWKSGVFNDLPPPWSPVTQQH
jgi:hypothetical protein